MAIEHYRGVIRPDGTLRLEVGDRQQVRPVAHIPLQDAWEQLAVGRSGDGALATSLSILVDALGEQAVWMDSTGYPLWQPNTYSLAAALCRRFMHEVVSLLPEHEPWVISRVGVLEWVDRQMDTPGVHTPIRFEWSPAYEQAREQEYVAADRPEGGITLWVGPVDRPGPEELRPLEHLAAGRRAPHLASGYNGKGPVDAALTILVDALGEQAMWRHVRSAAPPPSEQLSRARALQYQFAREVISRMPKRGGWTIPRAEVRRWAERTLATPEAKSRDQLGG